MRFERHTIHKCCPYKHSEAITHTNISIILKISATWSISKENNIKYKQLCLLLNKGFEPWVIPYLWSLSLLNNKSKFIWSQIILKIFMNKGIICSSQEKGVGMIWTQ